MFRSEIVSQYFRPCFQDNDLCAGTGSRVGEIDDSLRPPASTDTFVKIFQE